MELKKNGIRSKEKYEFLYNISKKNVKENEKRKNGIMKSMIDIYQNLIRKII